MTHITLNEAREYCNRISQLAGFDVCYVPSAEGHLIARENIQTLAGYRLPTDAEWERACRAGSATGRFFGNVEGVLLSYAWTKENEPQATKLGNSILLTSQWGIAFVIVGGSSIPMATHWKFATEALTQKPPRQTALSTTA